MMIKDKNEIIVLCTIWQNRASVLKPYLLLLVLGILGNWYDV